MKENQVEERRFSAFKLGVSGSSGRKDITVEERHFSAALIVQKIKGASAPEE
jgi:hypothetical protein